MSSNENRHSEPADPNRRSALRRIAGGVLGLYGLAGCRAAAPESPEPVEVALAELPAVGRLRILHGEHPVELKRTENGVEARSLWCTHWGCEVSWDEEQDSYLCPCHQGVFDRDGRVVSGPPPRPLNAYPVEIRGSSVLVGAGGSEVAG